MEPILAGRSPASSSRRFGEAGATGRSAHDGDHAAGHGSHIAIARLLGEHGLRPVMVAGHPWAVRRVRRRRGAPVRRSAAHRGGARARDDVGDPGRRRPGLDGRRRRLAGRRRRGPAPGRGLRAAGEQELPVADDHRRGHRSRGQGDGAVRRPGDPEHPASRVPRLPLRRRHLGLRPPAQGARRGRRAGAVDPGLLQRERRAVSVVAGRDPCAPGAAGRLPGRVHPHRRGDGGGGRGTLRRVRPEEGPDRFRDRDPRRSQRGGVHHQPAQARRGPLVPRGPRGSVGQRRGHRPRRPLHAAVAQDDGRRVGSWRTTTRCRWPTTSRKPPAAGLPPCPDRQPGTRNGEPPPLVPRSPRRRW